MSWATLRFRDPDVEEAFATENYRDQIGITRFWITMGAVAFAAYGILDYFIVPEILYQAWFIRFGIACPLLLGLAGVSYAPWFGHRHQFWLSLCVAIPGLSVVAMIGLADPPGNYLYYAGLVVVTAYAASLWRMSFLYSTFMSSITLAAYEATVIWINPLPPIIQVSNNAFIGVLISISVLVNYIHEQQQRRNYINREKLKFEQRRSERLLRQSEAANRAKNDFLAVMSHELRTPLNAIIGFSEIIANQMFGPIGQEKYRDYALDINSSGEHLLGIINDILDISKAEAGKLELNEEPIDPVDALNQAMRMFRHRAKDLKVELSFRVRDEMPWIIADGRLFNQVAINVVSNALKFTPEGGAILIELYLNTSGDLVLRVQDSGIGIQEDDVQRIFEPFVQVEGALNRSHQGTGLGLPLVRKIMSLHGGTVELTSEVGEGTEVKATFPSSRFVAPSARDDLKWGAS